MQCYQSQALRLLLFADTAASFPDTFLDPLVLEDVVDEFDIVGVKEYTALEPDRRFDLAQRVSELSPMRPLVSRRRRRKPKVWSRAAGRAAALPGDGIRLQLT